MPQRSSRAALLALGLDARAPLPLQRQLYDQLREAVLAGRLAPGTRLPASRGLARELGCSRNTVLGAIEQLVAEGYLEGRVGSGTYVSGVLPEDLLAAKARGAGKPRPPAQSRGLSARGLALAGVLQPRPPRHKAFVAGLPDLDAFPFDLWGRALARTWRHPPRALLSHGDPAGYLPLRRAIVAYLKAVRAVDCAPEQVVITSGAQQALDLAARALLEPG
ncbi:MAG: GntR family transcriptional regulator, partial [Kiloniellales bacterium]|nr:GntR family transcriptional regulator [Kiloniellales bacterium]